MALVPHDTDRRYTFSRGVPAAALLGLWALAEVALAQDADTVRPTDIEEALVTGRDAANATRYWSCSSERDARRFPLRLWRDGRGFLGEAPIRWNVSGEDAATVETARGPVAMERIEFFASAAETDRFSTIDGTGDSVSCTLEGPSRVYGGDLFADDAGDATPFAGRRFGCSVRGGESVTRYDFESDRTGTGDAGPFRWFWDPALVGLVVVGDGRSEVLADVSFDAPGAPPGSGFTARLEGAPIDCEPLA